MTRLGWCAGRLDRQFAVVALAAFVAIFVAVPPELGAEPVTAVGFAYGPTPASTGPSRCGTRTVESPSDFDFPEPDLGASSSRARTSSTPTGAERVVSLAEYAHALLRCPVYVAVMDLASIPGASTPSRAVWELAMRASTAWSSQDPEAVAACYEETASLTINNGVPATGRVELAATAAGYMEAFPDLQVTLDHLHVAGDSAFWVWTLTGTNTGPGGTGNAVRVSGIEVWRIGASGLVANSTGYYDAATYERQVAHGIDG